MDLTQILSNHGDSFLSIGLLGLAIRYLLADLKKHKKLIETQLKEIKELQNDKTKKAEEYMTKYHDAMDQQNKIMEQFK